MAEADTNLANLATSLSTLATAVAARVDDGTDAHEAWTECIEREQRRIREAGQERIAGIVGQLRAPGYRMLKEGW